jgi:hypothetical protein
LRLDIGVATTNAQQSGVAMQDIVLVPLQRADELCHLAADQDVDMTRVVEAFVERPSRISAAMAGIQPPTKSQPPAHVKNKPQPEVEVSDWGRKGFCYRPHRLG